MQEIYIHVGLHKTGSTFLQNKVFPNLEKTTYIGRPYTQQNIAFNKLQYADSSLYSKEEVNQEIKHFDHYKKVLISDEMFSGLPFNNYINRTMIADRLSQVFPEAKILLFIRNQKDLLLSLYNSYVKNNSGYLPINKFIWYPSKTYTYEDYIHSSMGWDFNSRYFNHMTHSINPVCFLYKQLIDLYKSKFKNVEVFLYEDLASSPQKLFSQIEASIEDRILEKEKINIKDKVNSSLDLKSISKKREENKLKNITRNNFLLHIISQNTTKYYEVDEINYINKLVDNFYKENNQSLLKNYPDIGINKYPNCYQI